jgi:hypothetical protein
MQDGGVNNMADLTELYKTIAASAPDPLAWQKGLVGNYILQNEQLNLQEKQRQIAEEQRLRELFQRNQAPTAAELGAISPSFMQQYGRNQFDMMKQQSEMQNMQSQISERVNKMAAGALGANADQYDADIASGMPPAMALNKFHTANGSAIRQLQESGLPIPPGSYDPESITPDAGHRAAQQFGIMTNRTKAELDAKSAEAQTYARGGAERRMGPMPSAQQAFGYQEVTPEGIVQVPPIPMPSNWQPSRMTDDDIKKMKEQYNALKTGDPEKDRIGAMLADAVKQRLPSGQFITPEEVREIRLKNKVRETTEIEGAKQGIEDKKAIDSYFRGRPPEQIRQLIKESIAGDVEAGVERIAKAFGMSTTGGSAQAALETIAQQMIESSPYAPGSQSNIEFGARMKKIGDPASNEPIKNRLAALDEYFRDRQAFIADKAQMSEPELIDAVGSGHITPEMAIKIRKRMMRQSGASR